MSKAEIGAPAPDLVLTLDDGSPFRLADHIGHPIVLFFYPEDDTSGCTTENQEFSLLAPEFAKRGAKLIGVSPDDIARHQRFRAKHGLTVPLAADPERDALEVFGLWQLKKLYGREFMGVIRTSVLIGSDGRVVHIVKASRIAGHAAKMLALLDEYLATTQ